jgi:hypothetical protein
MDVSQLLSLLPDSVLEELALATNVNRYSKKLQGEIVFKLLLHCILSYKDNSLRTMESAYESFGFRLLNAKTKGESIRFSSISERLSVIEPAYFERLYALCVEQYGALMPPQKTAIIRFDSTLIALSSKLLKVGYHITGAAANFKQLKFTIGFTHLPTAVHFFTEQVYTSENEALGKAVLSYDRENTSIIRVFDRGINARKVYDELTENHIPFISRLNLKTKHEIISDNKLNEPLQTDSLIIHDDRMVYLFKSHGLKAETPVRYIQATRIATGESMAFITNIGHEDLNAADVTICYKHRWDIEVFFKFIKQELNFSHLVNRSENGIKVMLYSTMIAAILLLAYKELNGIKGYKIMKQKFINELEKTLMKDFVVLCGGDPNKVDWLLKTPPE